MKINYQNGGVKMAFTGKKIKGGKVLTPETVDNRGTFMTLINEIKELKPEEAARLKEEMFCSMFEHLSHSSQKEFIEWARNVNWNTFMTV
jgi:hypothetical protein